jgi:hypothetical protein
MPFATTRQYDIPEENVKGKSLKEGTDSLIGLRHKQSETMPDTYQPYAEDFADTGGAKPGVKPAMQGPNEQSIVASGMTVEEWKFKHPKAVLGPNPEDIGQITTDPPDGSEPQMRPIEDEVPDEPAA